MTVTYDVSVVVCTRNGATRLRTHLWTVAASVAAASVNAEFILVDNGSTDDAVLAAVEAAPSVRVVTASEAGLARARNIGVRAAQGRVVLFTDDDVETPRGWVDRMSAPLLGDNADVVVGGIRVDDGLRLPWMSSWLLQQFADHPKPAERDAFVVGANFGAVRSVLVELPFNEDLGVPPYQREEDAFFWIQAREAGLRVVGVGGEPVRHCFDPDRLRTPALLSLAETMGRCEAYIWYHWLHGNAPHLAAKEAFYRLNIAIRRARMWQHPSDAELKRVARLAFIRELRRLEGMPRRFPAPTERARLRAMS